MAFVLYEYEYGTSILISVWCTLDCSIHVVERLCMEASADLVLADDGWYCIVFLVHINRGNIYGKSRATNL